MTGEYKFVPANHISVEPLWLGSGSICYIKLYLCYINPECTETRNIALSLEANFASTFLNKS